MTLLFVFNCEYIVYSDTVESQLVVMPCINYWHGVVMELVGYHKQ